MLGIFGRLKFENEHRPRKTGLQWSVSALCHWHCAFHPCSSSGSPVSASVIKSVQEELPFLHLSSRTTRMKYQGKWCLFSLSAFCKHALSFITQQQSYALACRLLRCQHAKNPLLGVLLLLLLGEPRQPHHRCLCSLASHSLSLLQRQAAVVCCVGQPTLDRNRFS